MNKNFTELKLVDKTDMEVQNIIRCSRYYNADLLTGTGCTCWANNYAWGKIQTMSYVYLCLKYCVGVPKCTQEVEDQRRRITWTVIWQMSMPDEFNGLHAVGCG